VIAAHAEAEARGEGVALLEGRLVENLHGLSRPGAVKRPSRFPM
jgi:hypothetical protein